MISNNIFYVSAAVKVGRRERGISVKKALCLLLTVLLLGCLLCGCSRLSVADSILGSWRSEDGRVVRFDETHMTLLEPDGRVTDGFPVPYIVVDNILHIIPDGQATAVFECRPDGRTLELVFQSSFMLEATGEAKEGDTIVLVRCD